MTRHPYGHDELDRVDPELDAVAREMERIVSREADDVPDGLRGRIHAAIDAEPDPAAGWWQRLTGAGGSNGRRPVGAMAGAGLAALALVAAVAVGQLIRDARDDVGASPSPSVQLSPSIPPTPSPTTSPSFSPSPTPTPTALPPTPSPSVAPTAAPTVAPTASDDDDDDETPEPSETDNSGPGGGGGDDDD
jgi:hypothetical protein